MFFAIHLQVVTAPYERVFPSEKDNKRDFEDNCKYRLYELFHSRLNNLNKVREERF